ncbi:MAG: hypothetical protein ABIP48_15255 [Planctomycetota bacterium]
MSKFSRVGGLCLAAIDFTTVEVWTKGGLVTYYLLFVMEVATRRVHFAGCTPNPDEPWMRQIARNLTNFEDGFLNDTRYLVMDRDGRFCLRSCEFLETEGVNCVKLAPKSPNFNAQIERCFKSLKEEALERMILFWRKIVAKCGQRIPSPLSRRKKSLRS